MRVLGAAACLGLAFVLAAPQIHAGVREIDPGDIPELAPDEGLLLVGVDTSVDLDSVRFMKDGRLFFGGEVLRRIKKGSSLQLYAATAGAYQLTEIRAFNLVRYDLRDDAEYEFQVEPGKITYAGDFIFRHTGLYSATILLSNRGLRALDWLEAQHPALAGRYEFVYDGHYPDPFPAFYRKERGRSEKIATGLDAVRAPPAPGAMPLAIEDLWRKERIQGTALNPAGDLLAIEVRESDDLHAIDLIDLEAGSSTRILKSPYAFASMQWGGNRVLLAGATNGDRQLISVVRVGEDSTGTRTADVALLSHFGWIVDPLPRDSNAFLFASIDSRGELRVHRVDSSSSRSLRNFEPWASKQLNRGVPDDVDWYTDGQGRLRAALVRRDEDYVLLHGDQGAYIEVLRMQADGGFDPMALSSDGNLIYGLTDDGRAQRDLVVFDPVQRRVTRTLFSKPGVDIVGPLFDVDRNLIGAAYYAGGRLVSEYFAEQKQSMAEMLRRAFPGRTVAVIERSQDGNQLVLLVDGSDQPPMLYHLDVARRRASLLAEYRPWLKDRHFAPSRLVSATSRDGLPIEAYLTLPDVPGKRPLVVLPHGGPVGVSDRRHFNEEVQFIASLGYAVLQINFRGSEGYGRSFREAGRQALGTSIEDDIDAALQKVLAEYPVDGQRMCVAGSSYGGYSALISVVRWPGRFRCAISIAGVSDRLLLFTASDGGHSAEGREQLERVFGDPDTMQEEMIATSPLYRYRDVQTPVMLVHGKEDLRADYEHTRRMVRMLNLAGHPPAVLSFDDEGHGIVEMENIVAAWSGIAGFLRQHLDPPQTAAAAGTTPVAQP